MTKPSGLIPEGGSVTLTCLTDESNPVADIVWTKGNTVITTGVANTVVTDGVKYNGERRQSVLRFTASRSDNMVVYNCYVTGQRFKDSHTLNVECMYFINFNWYASYCRSHISAVCV